MSAPFDPFDPLAGDELAARDSNERVVGRAAEFRLYADSRLPLRCECGNPNCSELVMLLPTDYQEARLDSAWRVLAAEHVPFAD